MRSTIWAVRLFFLTFSFVSIYRRAARRTQLREFLAVRQRLVRAHVDDFHQFFVAAGIADLNDDLIERVALIAKQFVSFPSRAAMPVTGDSPTRRPLMAPDRGSAETLTVSVFMPWRGFLLLASEPAASPFLTTTVAWGGGSRSEICPSSGVCRNVRTKNASNWKAMSSMAARFSSTSVGCAFVFFFAARYDPLRTEAGFFRGLSWRTCEIRFPGTP